MTPSKYLKSFAANVVKRSGICLPTVEALLPHVFDEIRYQLTEGTLCVPIEGFGTFAVVDIPERQRHYTYKGADEIRTLPPKLKIKFAPTRNLRREIDAHSFDPTRRSFSRHPDDSQIRYRSNMAYNKRSKEVFLQPCNNSLSPKTLIAFDIKEHKPRTRRNPQDSPEKDVNLSPESLTTSPETPQDH